MTDSDTDATFALLPAYLRKQIDLAMDAVLSKDVNNEALASSKSLHSNKLGSISSTSGGFIIDDNPQTGDSIAEDEGTLPASGGGFLMEDDAVMGSEDGGFIPSNGMETQADESKPLNTRIPLELIPQALQLLDLQPDDTDVLEVFRNAASGWEATGHGRRSMEEQGEALFVSRRDWRAVCAALLDTSGNEDDDSHNNDVQMEEEEQGKVDEDEESELSEEEYVDSGDEQYEDSSGDEYQEGGFVRSKPSFQSKDETKPARQPSRVTDGTRKSYSSNLSGDVDQMQRITARQRTECRRTFALFFPDVPDSDLDGKRIMIRDIATVADILKEKISAEEIVEMLEAFSTFPDKSMSLANFETMMIVAKMA